MKSNTAVIQQILKQQSCAEFRRIIWCTSTSFIKKNVELYFLFKVLVLL